MLVKIRVEVQKKGALTMTLELEEENRKSPNFLEQEIEKSGGARKWIPGKIRQLRW